VRSYNRPRVDPATVAALGIIATVIVALTTLVVAFQTKRLATQADRQVTEMETARRLEWTPYLTYQPSSGGDSLVGYAHYTATITNIGRGPAFDCFFIRLMGSTGPWCKSTHFDLGYNQKEEFNAPGQSGPRPDFLSKETGVTTVLFCQEQSGTCHMFGFGDRPRVSASPADAPPWAEWYRKEIAPR